MQALKKIECWILVAVMAAMLVLAQSCKEEDTSDQEDPPPTSLIDSAQPTEYYGYNNSTDISGDAIGSAEVDNTELYKTLTIKTVNPTDNFLLGPAIMGRKDNTTAMNVHFIMQIKNNTSNAAYCGIETTAIQFQDRSGEKLVTDAINKEAYGSIGIEGSADLASCLAPGETGYFLQEIKGLVNITNFYSEVKAVQIDEITVESNSVSQPMLGVNATGYSYGSFKLTLDATNDNTDTAYIYPSDSYYMLLHEDKPIYYGKVDALALMAIQLRPGNTTQIETSEIVYTGSVNKIRVLWNIGVDAWDSAW